VNALVLSAGLGTRFLPTTEKIAKPAIPFLNIPLMGYSLVYLESLGVENVVFNTHHLPETVKAAANKITKSKYKTTFSHEPIILGSGGGIKNNEALLRSSSPGKGPEDFVVINGDEVMLFKHTDGLSRLLAFHRANSALATLLTTVHPEAGRTLGGVWSDSDGRITRLGEKYSEKDPPEAKTAKHFTGVFIFSPRIFEFMPKAGEFHIFKDCLLPAIKAGEKVMAYNELGMRWFDTTDIRSYVESTEKALDELHRDSEYGRNLWMILGRYGHHYERVGEAQWLGAEAKFEGALKPGSKLFMGPGSFIDTGVEVSGFGVLGERARFSQGIIESSAIASGIHVNEMVALRKQLIV
jgi:mannose-1-phosphate guanylyltransferase